MANKNSADKNRARDNKRMALVATGAAAVAALSLAGALRGLDAESASRTPRAGVVATSVTTPPPAAGVADDVRQPAPGVDLDALLAQASGMKEVVVPPQGDQPGFTYRVPKPGAPEFADYKAMLSHPEFRRFLQEKPLYYDPEWRAQITGKREAARNDLQLQDAAQSLEQLLKFVLLAVVDKDRQTLDRLRVSRDEYQLILWPEFPQSRPFLRIPPDEAWSFQVAKMKKGAEKILNRHGGSPLEVNSFSVGSRQEFTNFRILDGVTLVAENADSGERVDLDFVEAVVECHGKYKVLMYGD